MRRRRPLLCVLNLCFRSWPESVGDGRYWRCRHCRKLTPVEARSDDGSSLTLADVVIRRLPTVDIAYCPEHGLHGERETCFVCDQPVVRIPMRPVAEAGHPTGDER